ncbi:MAG: hypothetical protein LQ347_004604 [Umbilicaria vellea]|nr:MAG: hypothetical protein LQ347_004604 [Umbilicaria vellea]
MAGRRGKRPRLLSGLEVNPSPLKPNPSNTRRLSFGPHHPSLTNAPPSKPPSPPQLLRLQRSTVQTPPIPQPEPTRPSPFLQMQLLPPVTLAEIQEQAVRHSGDGILRRLVEENVVEDGVNSNGAAFERYILNTMKEDEDRSVETAIQGIKAWTAKQRDDVLRARELSDARWAGEAWAIAKDREAAQRARYKSQAREEVQRQEAEERRKAGCANHTPHLKDSITKRKRHNLPRTQGGRSLAKQGQWGFARRCLSPNLQLFDFGDAEVSITMNERREKAAWNPPFIPRSFEGLPFALHSDAEHSNDRSVTSDFAADVPQKCKYEPVDFLPDHSNSQIYLGGNKRFVRGHAAGRVWNEPSYERSSEALRELQPSTVLTWANARPHFLDVFVSASIIDCVLIQRANNVGIYADIRCLQFISSRGNEYFCEIDEDYLTDRFNLTGLNTDVQYYQYALDLVTDVFDLDCDDDMRETIEKSARHLYGLVHARYITTTRGLAKMLDKYKKGDFGKCPRVMCNSHLLLPTGMADLPNVQSVKLYCSKCEDLYNPKSSRHSIIDGAYFGTSFQNILFQVYPALIPEKSIKRYEPKVFGFKVHAAAALQRWQDGKREDMQGRLKGVGLENAFVEDTLDFEDEMQDEEVVVDGDGMEVGEEVAI